MEPTYRHRLPSCPFYDMASVECWLEDMAQKGLHLDGPSGFFAGLGTFTEGEPAAVRYRLEAVIKRPTIWDDREAPTDAALDLAEEFGWEYVCRWREFDIYRTADPLAPELNTDPTVQAQGIKAVEKRLRSAVHMAIYWSLLYPLLNMRGTVLTLTIHCGLGLMLWITGLIALHIGKSVYRAWFLSRIRKALQRGERPPRPEDLDVRRKRHILSKLLSTLAWVGLLIVICIRWSGGTLDYGEARLPLADFEGTVPFATIAGFGPDNAVYKSETFPFGGDWNTFARWQGPLVRDAIVWDENAILTLPDDNTISGGLYVQYYDCRWEALARRIAKELYWLDRFQWNVEEIGLPELAVDYARGTNRPFNTVILQEDTRVMRVYFYNGGNQTVSLDTWVTLMAESILKQ
ncbi:MAG: DUF2812 domain-containing protein [Clostridia bacterium]|nr:DUF2812 domain-containing protein [Clostridia bacterium]